MQEFAALRSNTPDHPYCIPTFDWRHSDQSNSRWLCIRDAAGQVAGFNAVKAYSTHDMNALLRSGKIFYDSPPFDNIKLRSDLSFVSGECYYRGGMYVFPEHRKSGVAFALAIYSQALAIAEGIDFITGNAFQYIVDAGIPTHTYGFETIDMHFTSTSYCPLTGPLEGVKSTSYFLTSSRSYFTRNVVKTCDFLVSGSNKDLLASSRFFKRLNIPEKRSREAVVNPLNTALR
ncbi:MAG: hypothetical protein MI743_18080 [Sneathiellales bacterium]|nr:hypothetical protein [Sneathiellales bacterium]